MTDIEFILQYWKQYILIEREFARTLNYAPIAEENGSTFSPAYMKLLLEIGSEIDVAAKLLCSLKNPGSKADNIQQYRKHIEPEVPVIIRDRVLVPWSKDQTLGWWKTYNAMKHNRNGVENGKENYKLANQDNTLLALAGLYQLYVYCYSLLPHDPHVETPMPGSRLFVLRGEKWDKVHSCRDEKFYIDEETGYLRLIVAPFS